MHYPADHQQLQSLLDEEKPAGWGTWMAEGSAGHTFSTQEIDELQGFVDEFGPDLMIIEKDAVAIDPSAGRPWSEMVEPAWLSYPNIIENRADLMESAANTYAELHDTLSEELGAYHLEMWEIRQPKLEKAQDLLIPEQVAASAAPDLGASHDMAVLPRGLRGYDTWNDGTAWRPNGSGAAAAPR